MSSGFLTSRAPTRAFVLGNEAIARAALEAGIRVYAGYPGSPTVEILESILEAAPSTGVSAEISTNEKVALETAAGAAMAGARALVSMKSVGLNVASDTFFSLAYTGVKGGLVLVVADDPSAHSSQSEQDGRSYAPAAEVPMLEPCNPQDAHAMVKEAFRISEEFGVPVILRTVTRVNHQSGIVQSAALPVPDAAKLRWTHAPARFVTVAGSARRFHAEAVRRTEKIREAFESSLLNSEVAGEGGIGIITAGAGYNYAMEACGMLGISPPMLRLGTVWPLPSKLISRFLPMLETVVVIEELSPFLEDGVCLLAREAGPGLRVVGKRSGHLPQTLEYDTEVVATALAGIFSIPLPVDFAEIRKKAEALRQGLPSRPPTFCPGCPHRGSLSILRAALRGVKHIVSSDIGCYSMGPLEPIVWGDSVLAMGASAGIANGLSYVAEEKVIALIGDSTFFHAGIPGILNAVYRDADFKLVILDNGVTAMTGQQVNPGTAPGDQLPGRTRIAPEALVKALGVEQLTIVDPYDRAAALPAVKTALEAPGFGVVIFRRECALHADRNKRKKGERISRSRVSPESCKNFHTCIRDFLCPALYLDDDGKAVIDRDLCDGCLECAKLCPNSAISHEEA
jgi:indolepyruvate ferredoxin oxidoreductase alpha subunit